ncbi:MAG: hypothetical protein CSB06_01065 [Bacteroidia bacterium]|nr:MAG: hypothetical protein CSB06_01065 [Bacteroidia bacterium]
MGQKKESKSRRKIVSTAKTLFSNNGFRKMTVENICQKAGVSKMTFYRYFQNRTQLVQLIVELIFEENRLKYRELMDAQLPFTIKMYRWTTMRVEGALSISSKLAEDIKNSEILSLQAVLQKETEKEEAMILEDIKAAQKQNQIRKNLRPELVLYLQYQMVEMTHKSLIDNVFTNKTQAIIDITDFFFYGILQK